jgi:hypothetical protein
MFCSANASFSMGIPVHELLPAANAGDHSPLFGSLIPFLLKISAQTDSNRFLEAKSGLADDHPGHPETVANRSYPNPRE